MNQLCMVPEIHHALEAAFTDANRRKALVALRLGLLSHQSEMRLLAKPAQRRD